MNGLVDAGDPPGLDRQIRFPLRARLVVGVVLLTCLLTAGVSLVAGYQMREAALDHLAARGFGAARSLALGNTSEDGALNSVGVRQRVAELVSGHGISYAALLHADGRVSAYHGPLSVEPQLLSPAAIEWVLRGHADRFRLRVLGREAFCEVSVPVFLGNDEWGRVLAGISLEGPKQRIVRTQWMIGLAGLLVLLIGAAGAVFLADRMTRTVHGLVRNVDAVMEGRYDAPAVMDTGDEIGHLARRFAAMQTALEARCRTMDDIHAGLLQSNDQLQHEIQERMMTENALDRHRQHLESAVEQRTCELKRASENLLQEVRARQHAESESRSAQARAEAAIQDKRRFLARMRHEIHSPVDGFLAAAASLSKTRLDERQAELVEMIQTSGRSLLEIVHDSLEMSHIEAGKLMLEIVDFNLHELCEDVAGWAYPAARRKGVDLCCHIHRDVVPGVRGDGVRIRRVLSTLVDNAVRFTTSGWVSIEVSLMQDIDRMILVRFDVRDTGIGLTPDQMSRVFAPLTRTAMAARLKHRGRNLDLSVCRHLVEKMDGAIGVKSEPGKGAAFWFTIYLEKQPAAKEAAPPFAGLAGRQVLAVDGSRQRRRILRDYLGDAGMGCASADTLATAVRMVHLAAEKGNGYDAVLVCSDIHEAGAEGALEDLAGPDAALPLIIMAPGGGPGTAPGRGPEKDGGKMSGRCPAVLERPIRRSALYACLAALAPMHGGGAPSGANDGKAPSPFSSPRRRVLLAEDNPFNQNFYQILLEQCGCDVDIVDSGLAALAAWRRKRYDLILMDGEMPEMDGYEATEKIRRQEREAAARKEGAAGGPCSARVPIIAVTGHTYREARRKCLAAGMDDCLCKPFTIVQLGEKLDMWIPDAFISSCDPGDPPRMNSTGML